MPLQQISVSPLDWAKDRSNSNQQKQKNLKLQDPVFTTSGLNPLERCPSQASTLSNNNDICRICHCESEEDAPLIAPCYCAGSLRYVHQACLQQWIKSSDIRSCELCKFQFVMQSKLKPFNKWESLEMNGVERRKLLCSVTFHAVALTCVVWSLYVLVDRTVEEIHRGLLEWPFWTKLIVVAIGFAGGVVFMYIQCKAYLHLCRRWRAFNRVIYVQNAPEKAAMPPAAGVVRQDSSFASETCCGVVVVTSEGGGHVPAAVHGKGAVESAPGGGDPGERKPPETEPDPSREGERSRLLGAEDRPSSSEDSFKSLSTQLLAQNQRSTDRRPWASLDSCAAGPWTEGSPARGSRSPLLTTPAPPPTPPAPDVDRDK